MEEQITLLELAEYRFFWRWKNQKEREAIEAKTKQPTPAAKGATFKR